MIPAGPGATEPPPGELRLGPYELLGELARGGQGVVYRARHATLGTDVALKLLADLTQAKRFQQEAQVLARLRHPHLLGVTALGQVDGRPYMAMELIEGRDLKSLVRERGVPEVAWTVEVLGKIAGALQYCHEQGIVHRDLKPANILIEETTDRPVLVDFGLIQRDAQLLSLSTLDQGTPLSLTGETKGTPSYMAPEQIDPESFGEVGPRADVYALGGTLYTLLTGEPPFSGPAPVNVMVQVLQKAPPDPREKNPDVPPALSELCRRALDKKQGRRPASASAFADALTALPPPRRAPWIALGVVAVLLVAALGWRALTPDPNRQETVELEPDPRQVAPRPRPVVRLEVTIGTLEEAPAVADLDGDGVKDLVGNRTMHAASRQADVLAISGKTGQTLWTHPGPTNISAQVAIDGGSVVAAQLDRSGRPELVWLDGRTGRPTQTCLLLRTRYQDTKAPWTPFRIGRQGADPFQWVALCGGADPFLAAGVPSGKTRWRVGPIDLGQSWAKGFELTRWAIDADGDGERRTIVWRLQGALVAFRPLGVSKAKILWRVPYEHPPSSKGHFAQSSDSGRSLLHVSMGETPELVVVHPDTGHVVRRKTFPGTPRQPVWLDLEGDGRSEVVFTHTGPNDTPPYRLLFLDGRTLEILKEKKLTGRPGPARAARIGKRPLLAMLLGGEGPRQVLLLDPNSLSEVWRRPVRPNSRLSVADLDDDGRDELILRTKTHLTVLEPDLAETR